MRRILIISALAVGALTVTGCASSATNHDPMPAVAPDADWGAPHAEMSYSVGSDARVPREVITTGHLTVSVEVPQDAADEAAAIVDRSGGHVSSRTERAATERDPGGAQLTLRIPSAKLSATLNELKALGDAREVALQDLDVTDESQDLKARITALQASVDRLLELMVDADSTTDLITVEQALSERQANLESLQARQRTLTDQVQLSTITLQLVALENTPPDEPDTFWTGLVAGWDGFVGFWATMLVAVGVLSPWLVLIAAVALAVVLIARASARRAQRAAPDAPESAAG